MEHFNWALFSVLSPTAIQILYSQFANLFTLKPKRIKLSINADSFLTLNKNTNRIDRVSTNTNAFRTVFFFFDFRSFLSHFFVIKIAFISVPSV